jgi:hypothetical protein
MTTCAPGLGPARVVHNFLVTTSSLYGQQQSFSVDHDGSCKDTMFLANGKIR